MIKLLVNYLHFEKGDVIDFGESKNVLLVETKLAMWVKIKDLKYATK
jgi:hypothetical protein